MPGVNGGQYEEKRGDGGDRFHFLFFYYIYIRLTLLMNVKQKKIGSTEY